MPGLDKNRFRNKTISFRMSSDERRLLESRIKVSNLSKREFFVQMLLHSNINIRVGKYESDRLSLELKRLREKLTTAIVDDNNIEVKDVLLDCKLLSQTLLKVIEHGNLSD